jgi:NAD+ kinase
VKRVGFVVKRSSSEAGDIARELGPRLRKEGVEIVEEAQIAGPVDLLLVLGGDGTFLRGAALGAPHGTPLLGVNLGSLGFLTAFSRDDAEAATLAALRGELPVEERMRLEVALHCADGSQTELRHALNDCVVSQGAIARLLDLEVTLDGTRVTVYKADGLIIATPTGSTAYNLAAGGPILMPDLQAIVLTPICPHTLTNRPLVAPGGAKVQVKVGAGSQNVVLTIDGQVGRPVAPGDRIVVRSAKQPLRMVVSPARGYFDVLRQKLNWGERTGR